MLNSNKTRQKKSRLQFRMGIIVAIIFLIQMLLTFLSSFISIVLTKNLNLPQWSDYSNTYQLLVKWGSWILLFTNFVPISLIVSLEMVKYIQGINMSNCKVLVKGSGQLNVQTSTLNEQLGQIQHLFSDKTGTLTCNYMSFKHMMIGSKVYGYGERQ